MIELKLIDKSYGNQKILDKISLNIKKGEFISIVGPSGAGKTTLLKGLSGLKQSSGGSIKFKNRDITRTKANDRATNGITLVPEGRGIFSRLTVMENLLVGSFVKKYDKNSLEEKVEEQLILFPRLRERLNQLAGTLSGGEQQMLAIARALIGVPDLLLLDEPSMGLAPIITEQILDVIRDINRKGVTVILVEQNAGLALKMARKAIVLESGEIVRHTNAAELLEDDSVKKAYLGI